METGEKKKRNGRPPGRKNNRTLLLNSVCNDPRIKLICEKVLEDAADGCKKSQEIVLARTWPPLKSVSLPVQFEFSEKTIEKNILSAVRGMATGSINSDDGSKIVQALIAASSALKLEQLEKRLLAIENENSKEGEVENGCIEFA